MKGFEPTLHLVDVPGTLPGDPLALLPAGTERAVFVFDGGELDPLGRDAWSRASAEGWLCLERGGASSGRTLGALAFSLLPAGEALMFHSNDPLLLQLAGPRVRVHAPARNTVFGPEEVKREMGVEPWQVPDYYALVGFPPQGVKGALGVDPPLARAVLERFAGVEEWAARPDLLDILGTPSAARLRSLLEKQGERLRADARRLNLHSGEQIVLPSGAFRRRRYANLI